MFYCQNGFRKLSLIKPILNNCPNVMYVTDMSLKFNNYSHAAPSLKVFYCSLFEQNLFESTLLNSNHYNDYILLLSYCTRLTILTPLS